MTLAPKCTLQQTQAKAAGSDPPSCYQQTCNYFSCTDRRNKKSSLFCQLSAWEGTSCPRDRVQQEEDRRLVKEWNVWADVEMLETKRANKSAVESKRHAVMDMGCVGGNTFMSYSPLEHVCSGPLPPAWGGAGALGHWDGMEHYPAISVCWSCW